MDTAMTVIGVLADVFAWIQDAVNTYILANLPEVIDFFSGLGDKLGGVTDFFADFDINNIGESISGLFG